MSVEYKKPNQKRKELLKKRLGTVLFVAILGVAVGTTVATSLMKFMSFNTGLVEKEIGNIKSAQALKLGGRLYLRTLEAKPDLSESENKALQKKIGGGDSVASIFGYTTGNHPSEIPGFRQFKLTLREFQMQQGAVMQPPDDGQGFYYFTDTLQYKNTAYHEDTVKNDVPAFRNKTKATTAETTELKIIPVFNMLSFYDRDMEFFGEEMGGFFSGRIHSNGNIFLVNIEGSNYPMTFHGPRDQTILSAHGNVYRRGRGGLSPSWWTGSHSNPGNTISNLGIEFYSYTDTNFEDILESNDPNYLFNVTDPGNDVSSLFRDLTPDYTNFDEGGLTVPEDDNTNEANARRYAYDGANFGYRFEGQSPLQPTKSFRVPDLGGDDYNIVSFGSSELAPPVSIEPYNYIEDMQWQDTPDTINYPSPAPSNYQEDAAAEDAVATYAYNSVAPIVIRDGVAYKRSAPGAALAAVQGNHAYPDPSHPNARTYGDLRWYGWFGQADGSVSEPTPDNPARWHFPIKSVTFNRTVDNNNGGNVNSIASGVTTSGTAVPFTFRSAAVYNPYSDGISGGNADWINVQQDLSDLAGYPGSNLNNATDTETGAGIGMFNVSYPMLGGNVERYDPVRVAYNLVKAQVRQVYNAHHIYTSRHNGIRMLNRDGSAPAAGTPPDIWGSGITAASFGGGGINYAENNSTSQVPQYSAFWQDDGASGYTSKSKEYRYLRVYVNNTQGASPVQIDEINFKTGGTNSNWPQKSPATFTVTQSSGAGANCFNNNDVTVGGDWVAAAATNQWVALDLGTNTNNHFAPALIMMHCSDKDAAPSSFKLQGSDNGTTWVDLLSRSGIDNWVDNETKVFTLYRTYRYNRCPGTTTYPLSAQLHLQGIDTTPAVELFPMRHNSLIDTSVAPNNINQWYIYKSTLPLSNRTLPMPANRGALEGWDYNSFYGGTPTDLSTLRNYKFSLPGLADLAFKRTTFGFLGNSYSLNPPEPELQTWYTLLNNAPEMLVRQRNLTHETAFSYYAGDAGGYYGNDNLTTIDCQEKKIVVFTEIDVAELTRECFEFNNVLDFTTNDVGVRDKELQNIIYVVNTSMGNNFFGKRVHCGAVRIKRGRVIPYHLSFASPNSIYVWGDYNVPGYWHHGPNQGNNSVEYHVPTTREHKPGSTIEPQASGLFCDTVQIIENNWIPFDQRNASRNEITDAKNGSLVSAEVNPNLGMSHGQFTGSVAWPGGANDFQGSGNYLDFTRNIWDHSLWWEDDGLRRTGGQGGFGMNNIRLGKRNNLTGTNNETKGTQQYLNYHELVFEVNVPGWYPHLTCNIFQRYAGGNPIMKLMPQAINGSFLYGNVQSEIPPYFWDSDVSAIPVTRPSTVIELDWLTSWIPRYRWSSLSRSDLITIRQGNSIKPSTRNSQYYDPSSNIKTSNFYGFNATQYIENEFEILKKRFGNIGLKLDVRSMHTYHWPYFPEFISVGGTDRQNYGRNFIGSYACLYDSRQTTHEQREKDNSWEGRSFFTYNQDLNEFDRLPPGTPFTVSLEDAKRTVGGTKWEY